MKTRRILGTTILVGLTALVGFKLSRSDDAPPKYEPESLKTPEDVSVNAQGIYPKPQPKAEQKSNNADIESESSPATDRNTAKSAANDEPQDDPREEIIPKNEDSTYPESPTVIQDQLVDDLSDFSIVNEVADVGTVECSDSSCAVTLKPKPGKESKLQMSFMRFMQKFPQYGNT